MVKMFELVGNAKKQDLCRAVNNELVPRRGKKKHGTQMRYDEKKYLITSLKSVKNWNMSKHVLERIEEKGLLITIDDIESTIHNSTIIEYHVVNDNYKEERVLLKAKKTVNKQFHLNIVYSITRGNIISAWLNKVTDNHNSLDWRDYDNNLIIINK